MKREFGDRSQLDVGCALSPSGALARLESWFADNGWNAFAFQREVWQAYLAGESGLVHSATGSGKTLAAWLGPLAEWMEEVGDRSQLDAGCALSPYRLG